MLFHRKEAKLKNLVVRINCTGCRICRPIYLRQLQNYYKDHLKDLCEDCGRRFKTNTLRLLDCRKEGCLEMREGAPNFFDKLCSPCSVHFSGVLEYLDELAISYALDNFFLSDFDHYNRTVFDISVEGAGSEQSNLASGGRYDYLFEKLGGKATPAVGVALGIERIIAALRAQGAVLPEKAEKRVFIIHVGELAKKKLLGIIETLRAAGIPVGEALSRESLGAQLKLAEREHAAVALMLGQKEIFEESVIIRDLQRRSQETVPLNRMVEEIMSFSRCQCPACGSAAPITSPPPATRRRVSPPRPRSATCSTTTATARSTRTSAPVRAFRRPRSAADVRSLVPGVRGQWARSSVSRDRLAACLRPPSGRTWRSRRPSSGDRL